MVEGCSIRSIERITGTHRDTVCRLLVRMGQHCDEIIDSEIRGVCTSSIQVDERWTYIGKKQRQRLPGDPEEWGDAYCFLAIDRESKSIPAYDIGKRTAETTDRFIELLSRRIGVETQILTDGFTPYRRAISAHFGKRAHFAQVIKHFDADSNEKHRYSPPKVRSIEHVWIQGYPRTGSVSTSHAERQNWTLRGHLRRFTRLSNGFSRKLACLRTAVAVYVCWYNWCRKYRSIGTTPAIAMELAPEPWTIDRLVA